MGKASRACLAHREEAVKVTEELQGQIGYISGQIDVLLRENESLKKNIEDLEEGGIDASSLAEKWRNILSDCYDAIKNDAAKVDPGSGFSAYYLNAISRILSGKEASEIGDSLNSIKLATKNKALEFERRIEENNRKIYRLQNQISELKAMGCAEGN